MAEILIIDSTNADDTSLQLAYDFRRAKVDPRLSSCQRTVLAILGVNARRIHVAQALLAEGVRYVTGLGHGFPTSFTGAYAEDLLEVGSFDPREAQGKVFHLLSCWTGDKLGRELVRQGARAFFGYVVPFTFTVKCADEFLKCDAEIDIAVSEGLSARETYERTDALYRSTIQAMEDRKEVREAAYLEDNLENLCSPSVGGGWGDPSVCALEGH